MRHKTRHNNTKEEQNTKNLKIRHKTTQKETQNDTKQQIQDPKSHKQDAKCQK